MNCPQCDFKMGFQERVCRRCQFCPELNNSISVEVPRSSQKGAQSIGLFQSAFSRLGRQRAGSERKERLSPLAVFLLGFVPGLGHILSGARLEGLFYLAAVPALVLAALYGTLDASLSLTLLGIGFGLHVTSLFRLVQLSLGAGIWARLAVHMLILLVLSLTIYAPLSGTLLRLKPEMTTDRTSGIVYFFGSLTTFVFILAGAWILSQFLSLVFSLPEKRKQ